MTTLLRSLSADEHFGFRFSPEAMPEGMFDPPTPQAAEAARQRTARVNNFGVLKAERLAGNIGLIDLDQFTDPAVMRRPLAAAMDLLRHCDAMIIDLRYNGGGDARGAALVASYFLPETPSQVLQRFETRNPGDAVEISTEGRLESDRFLDRPVYILTSPDTFSAAEFLISTLRRTRGAVVVGTRTRGGAHPVQRIRLTAHYGLMLPTTRGVTRAGSGSDSGIVTPDIPTGPREAQARATLVALSALLGARPDDPLAERWKELVERAAEPPVTAAPPPAAQRGSTDR
jgi:C-terminal processing protease CtpA/Prc